MKYAVLLLLLCGCTPLTTAQIEAREYKRQENLEHWRLCEMVYKKAGVPTYHINHMHDNRHRITPNDIRMDLMHHNCHAILDRAGMW